MLSIFPDFLTYALFAPPFLRIALGAFVISKSYKKLRPLFTVDGDLSVPQDKVSKIVSVLFLLSGIFILIGLYTQISALMLILLTIGVFIRKGSRGETLDGTETWLQVFVFVMALSLMLSGAGFYAIDLPL